MKFFRVFVFCILLWEVDACSGADFTTGQAARAVIGQLTFTEGDSGASDTLVGAIGGIAYANNTLFVADSNRFGAAPINNRVLVYQNILGSIPKPTDLLSFTEGGGTCLVCVGGANLVLGQPDFTTSDPNLTQTGLRTPTAVASDGVVLAVADTDNNRVLIWNSVPVTTDQPADVVVGQTDFTHNATAIPPTAKSLRGPQGVWIQNGKLFIADTQDNRVLIYNSIPTANGAAADLVLGQRSLTSFVSSTVGIPTPAQDNMLNPVSVTSDGLRLYVTDLGHNRVLIWNSIPTQNGVPADLEIGQPDFVSADANNSSKMCPSNGTDPNNNNQPTYPARCGSTLSFPRYALSDGKRLFVADGGNDRVLIYSSIPTQNAQAATYIIGAQDENSDTGNDSTDALTTPSSLAWDGSNLYVSDSFNRRIMIYTPAEPNIPVSGVRNAASREIFAIGGVTFGGTIKQDDSVTLKIQDQSYTYKVVKDDTFDNVVNQFVKMINSAPDPNVIALPDVTTQAIVLTARKGGPDGGNIAYSTTLSDNAVITATTSGANLSINLQNPAEIAPGTLITVLGNNLSDGTASANLQGRTFAPVELAGTRLYVDGIASPLLFVSPTQINAQLPYETFDRTSVSVYVRTTHGDGSVTVTTPVAVSVVPENPGIFGLEGTDPRPGIAYHSFSNATGAISVDGSINAGDVATVTIADRTYAYTVQASDTLTTVEQALIDAINGDPQVTATASNTYNRIILKATVPGSDGNGIAYTATVNNGAQLILTALTSATCCANTAGSPVTADNPAAPGETIYIYATGLGITSPAAGSDTGIIFDGSSSNPPATPVDSILVGGKSANVLNVSLVPGQIGVFKVEFELNSDLPTDPLTQLTIAQQAFVSNVVTVPIVAPDTSSP